MAYLDYQWASDWLAGGRKKYERPMYDRGLRMWKLNKWKTDSPIGIGWRWQSYPFVIYHPDNTITIQAQNPTGGWNPLFGYSTRFTIRRYSGIADLYQKNFKFHIVEQQAGFTKPKIYGCRQCKQTGLQDVGCYPETCWNVTMDGNKFICTDHPDVDLSQPSRGRWHYMPCHHGEDQYHLIKNGQTCYYCNGTKKRDYGSKRESILWDGSPLRIQNGKLIKSAATLLERMVADYVEPIA